MDIKQNVDYLKRNQSLHLHNLLPPKLCGEMIVRYDAARDNGQLEVVKQELIETCREQVFTDELNALLSHYFQGPVSACWPAFDVVGSAGPSHNANALWHLDGGIPGTHKLFIYLNPVAEHGGNTVMVDLERTKKLSKAGALPVERAERQEDLGRFFDDLEISPELLGYDLKAGDGLLFDPLSLAHRCQPTQPDKWRYTICFTLVPAWRQQAPDAHTINPAHH